MESPVRVEADITEGVNSWLTLLPEGIRAIGNRVMEGYDHWRSQRRAKNVMDTFSQAIPDIDETTAVVPEPDFLDEWVDLVSKRSDPGVQQLLAKAMAQEANTPGSVPLRHIVDMARLDKQVLDEFAEYCGWYVPGPNQVILDRPNIPRYVLGANLIEQSTFGHLQPIPTVDRRSPYVRVTLTNGEIIFLRNEKANIPMGNNRLTEFGEFIYGLLDDKPDQSPGLASHLRELWKDYLYEGDTTAQ